MNDSRYILEDALDLMRNDNALPLVMAVEKAAENYSDPETTINAMLALKAVLKPTCSSISDAYVMCTRLNYLEATALLSEAIDREAGDQAHAS